MIVCFGKFLVVFYVWQVGWHLRKPPLAAKTPPLDDIEHLPPSGRAAGDRQQRKGGRIGPTGRNQRGVRVATGNQGAEEP